MNFNPMDLIFIKEFLYRYNPSQYEAVSNFISDLLEIQKNGLPDEVREQMQDKGHYFDWKNELIELALKGGKI